MLIFTHAARSFSTTEARQRDGRLGFYCFELGVESVTAQ
jgi:hypothetical protein